MKLLVFILLVIGLSCSKKTKKPIIIIENTVDKPQVIVEDKASPSGIIVNLPSKKKVEFETTIYFTFDSYAIPHVYTRELCSVPDNVKELYLYGKTCDIGTDEYNLRLGYRRGNAVYEYLTTRAQDSSRQLNCKINIISLGESEATGNRKQDRCVHITTERQQWDR